MPGTGLKKSLSRYLLIAVTLLSFVGTIVGQERANSGRYVKLGVSRYARGDFDHAIEYFELALASNPHLASAYVNRGRARQAKGDLDAAISDYERAMELDSAVVETNNEIAQAYNRRGSIRVRTLELEEAINDFTRVIAFDPDNAESFLGRGTALLIDGDFEAAIKDLDSAIALLPANSTAYLIRGLAKIHLDESDDDVSRDFQKSLRLSRELPFFLQLQILEIEARMEEVKRHKLPQKLLIAE